MCYRQQHSFFFLLREIKILHVRCISPFYGSFLWEEKFFLLSVLNGKLTIERQNHNNKKTNIQICYPNQPQINHTKERCYCCCCCCWATIFVIYFMHYNFFSHPTSQPSHQLRQTNLIWVWNLIKNITSHTVHRAYLVDDFASLTLISIAQF